MSKRKYCSVSCCLNDSKETPEKHFVRIPEQKERREKWREILGIHIGYGKAFVCEDHFNLQEDCENWMYFKTIGNQLKLKKGVVPHRNIHNTTDISPQFPYSDKKRKQENLERWQTKKFKEQTSSSNIEPSIEIQEHELKFTEIYIKEGIAEIDSSCLEDTIQEPLQTDIEIKEHEVQYPEIYIREEIEPCSFVDSPEESLEMELKTDIEIDEHKDQFIKLQKEETNGEVLEERVPVTRPEVLNAINILRRAIEENDVGEENFCMLNKLEYVLTNALPQKQIIVNFSKTIN